MWRPDIELRAERFFPACTAPWTLTELGELTGKPHVRQAIRQVPAKGTCRCFAGGGQKCNRAEPYAARFTGVLQNFLSKSLPPNRECQESLPPSAPGVATCLHGRGSAQG